MERAIYNYSQKNKDTGIVLQIVKVIMKDSRGEKFTGIAKCSPEDVFDLAFGTELATARAVDKVLKADYKAAEKRLKNAILKMDKAGEKVDKIFTQIENLRCQYWANRSKEFNLLN